MDEFQNETLLVIPFFPVKAVQHVALGATYSVGRRSAVLPRRRMTGPPGLRIFLTSALLSSENRLTRLKPKANGRFRNNAGRMTRWRSGSAVYRWCCAWLSEETASLPPVKRDTVHLWTQESQQVSNSFTEVLREDEALIWEEISTGQENEEKKKQRKESARCQQWNELRTRCAERGLTGCLAPSVSATVASVWWICSQPVRGGYQESVACQRGGRTGGETHSAGRQRPVNHCDPQLIDLFGAKDLGWDGCITRHGFLKKYTHFHIDWKCVYR